MGITCRQLLLRAVQIAGHGTGHAIPGALQWPAPVLVSDTKHDENAAAGAAETDASLRDSRRISLLVFHPNCHNPPNFCPIQRISPTTKRCGYFRGGRGRVDVAGNLPCWPIGPQHVKPPGCRWSIVPTGALIGPPPPRTRKYPFLLCAAHFVLSSCFGVHGTQGL